MELSFCDSVLNYVRTYVKKGRTMTRVGRAERGGDNVSTKYEIRHTATRRCLQSS